MIMIIKDLAMDEKWHPYYYNMKQVSNIPKQFIVIAKRIHVFNHVKITAEGNVDQTTFITYLQVN